jgi:hypothetical protein
MTEQARCSSADQTQARYWIDACGGGHVRAPGREGCVSCKAEVLRVRRPSLRKEARCRGRQARPALGGDPLRPVLG